MCSNTDIGLVQHIVGTSVFRVSAAEWKAGVVRVDSRVPVFQRRRTRCTAAVVSSRGDFSRWRRSPLPAQQLLVVRSSSRASRTSICRTPTTRPPPRRPPTTCAAFRMRRTRGRSSGSSDWASRPLAFVCRSSRCVLPVAAAAAVMFRGLEAVEAGRHGRVGTVS